MKCHHESCEEPSRARGWCIRHYHLMAYNHRVPFTRKLWDRWLARLNGSEQDNLENQYLAQGIAQFRATLAKREPAL